MRGPGPSFMQSIPFCRAGSISLLIACSFQRQNLRTWGVAELALFDKGQPVRVARTGSLFERVDERRQRRRVGLRRPGSASALSIASRSPGSARQRRARSRFQMTRAQWKTLQAILTPAAQTMTSIWRGRRAARYVRVLMTKPAHTGRSIHPERA